MGTWDVGSFDNDTAVDFCDVLDEAAAGERERLVRDALIRVLDPADDLVGSVSEEAVAAAALVAARCPGGDPVDPRCGPRHASADLTSLRSLAVQALDRAMSESSELLEPRGGSHGGPRRASIRRLQGVLLPQPPGEQLRLI